MHELSIALSIVDIAEKEVAKIKGESVSDIELEIGKLAGIEKEALEFAWPEAIKNSVLSEANRVIRWVEAEAICNECQKTYPINDLYDICPHCGSYFKGINKGKELKIKSLTIC
ncbi:MAG TPA: hydrogenase maturation nickel metallochaperone HypA [Cytophagales bacterium]|mgnify:FL=1|jgi:hydrogenase nickel incorporation protein HypA/HybF|nr:hydrogenase maturation nickel metallochaperone HypA [Cytophagales bacterium]